MLAGVENLVDFAQRQVASQAAERFHNAYIAGGYCLLHGRRGEEVTNKHSYMIVPHGIHRRLSATGERIVHHIVVNQRGIMKQFHGSGSLYNLLSHGAEHAGAHHEQKRPQLLPFGAQLGTDDTAHHRIGACQLQGYPLVEQSQIVGVPVLESFKYSHRLSRKFTQK